MVGVAAVTTTYKAAAGAASHTQMFPNSNALYLAHNKLAENGPVIMPYKVINRIFTTIYGIIIWSLSAFYFCALLTYL